jgi:PIN like domain
LKFFFDNNLSQHIAHAIGELSKIELGVDEVVHLSDLFPRNVPDLAWIPALTASGPWAVVTLDKLKKQGGAEREALRREGHTVFLLESQWSKQSFWLQAERMTRWWPQIVKQAALASGGAFVVPWHHSSKSKFRVVKL